MAGCDQCRQTILVNTGVTVSVATLIDCSGNTTSFSLAPTSGFTTYEPYITDFCSGTTISGDTLYIDNDYPLTHWYSFSSCCNNEEFIVYSSSKLIQTGETINIIDSKSYNGNVYTGCYTCTNTDKIGSNEPILDRLIYFEPQGSPIEGIIIYKLGCVSCLEVNPCPTICYKLYSCDNLYDPFYSKNEGLSGFVNNYVSLTTSGITNGCFYVTGVESCDNYEDVTINYDIMCECTCSCYTYTIPENSKPIIITYIDCNDNEISNYVNTGATTSICSKITPLFYNEVNRIIIPIKNNGPCINGECQKQPITIKPRNECDVITIFPMGVSCLVTNPSSVNSFDGYTYLQITGGTPPYTVMWENGSYGQSLSDLNIGEYSATVTDFYGDFIINTTCVLTATTTTSTTTTTTTIPVIYGPLCLSYNESVHYNTTTTQVQFEPSININNQPSWTGTTDYLLYWNENQWIITGSTINGDLVNNNPITPPLVGWQFLGNPYYVADTLLLYSGLCTSGEAIILNQIANTNVDCNNLGSIAITPNGGTQPYLYSINGGINYYNTPIFNNLQPGTYFIKTKDSLDNESQITEVLVENIPTQQYTLSLNVDQNTNTFTITPDSSLPPYQTISFNFGHISTFIGVSTINPGQSYDNIVSFGALGTMTYVGQNNSTDTIICGGYVTPRQIQQTTYTKALTINGGETITGSFTDLLNYGIWTPTECRYIDGQYTLFIESANCGDCCIVKIINPPLTQNLGGGNFVLPPKLP